MTSGTFFHIWRDVHWLNKPEPKQDQKIVVGLENNPFFQYFENPQTRNVYFTNEKKTKPVPIISFLGMIKDGDITDHKELPVTAYDTAMHLSVYIRELIWESVRKSEFSHLPSRMTCVWLIPDKDSLIYWKKELDGSFKSKLLKVETQGRYHLADSTLLNDESEPYSKMIERARKYWSGEISDKTKAELLFEGVMTVVSLSK